MKLKRLKIIMLLIMLFSTYQIYAAETESIESSTPSAIGAGELSGKIPHLGEHGHNRERRYRAVYRPIAETVFRRVKSSVSPVL